MRQTEKFRVSYYRSSFNGLIFRKDKYIRTPWQQYLSLGIFSVPAMRVLYVQYKYNPDKRHNKHGARTNLLARESWEAGIKIFRLGHWPSNGSDK